MALIRNAVGTAVLTVLVAGAVLWSCAAMAANSVVVESKNVATGATGVEIHVFLTNDIDAWSGAVVPLVIRQVTTGAFITSLQMSYAERLASRTFWI